MMLCEDQGDWPANLKVGYVALIPKDNAETVEELRPIVVLPLFYRIWAASRRAEVKEWEQGPGRSDIDVLGRSALDAAWELACDVECAEVEQEHVAAVFLDCSKCYERIPLHRLQEEVTATQFPQRLANDKEELKKLRE